MKFDWCHYFYLAETWFDDVHKSGVNSLTKSDEAKLRSSISRAYYAAFCTARNYLRDEKGDRNLSNQQRKDLNVHQYVIETFLQDRRNKQSQIGRKLERLRSQRNQADYSDQLFNLLTSAERAVELAKQIIQEMEKLLD